MKCLYPLTLEGKGEVGCGQCTNCRINRRRMWVGRMLLEARVHPFSAFVTLTYDEESLPKEGNLCKKDLQDFLKRLRKATYPRRIRYYAVGEYGELHGRPHYHLIVFGLSSEEREIVEKCWPFGNVDLGIAEKASMSYVGYYVQKKLTKKGMPGLMGKLPEFAMMSLRPGIGMKFVDQIIRSLQTTCEESQKKILQRSKGVIRTEGTTFPLARQMKERIKDAVGIDPEQRREDLWCRITEKLIGELTEGVNASEKRKAKARRVYKEIAKNKEKLSKIRRQM